jgi:alpha-tubulin suppressor-like RCC1 family protein
MCSAPANGGVACQAGLCVQSCDAGYVACGGGCCAPTAAMSLASGDYTTCVVTYSGAVQCWGGNDDGQLGNGTTLPSSVPGTVSGWSSGITAVAVGYMHTCALTSAGGVQCLGFNNTQQLGTNGNTDSWVPLNVPGLPSSIKAIGVGHDNSLAVASDGSAWGWGYNSSGQLGVFSGSKAIVGLSTGVTAMDGGDRSTCVLTSAGGVKCLGSNAHGQLGNNTTTDSTSPVDVWTLTSGVTAIALGSYHACAIASGGAAKCWGANASGQLGNGSTSESRIPASVSGLSSGVRSISGGTGHTCAVVDGGGVMCWGLNSHGQLGNNSTANSSVPVPVSGISSGATAVAVGQWHSCALMSGGHVMCWGYNQDGELGNNSTSESHVPVAVTGF